MRVSTNWIVWAGRATSIIAMVAALPSLMIWLGLPPEGDAVDYRVPIIRWIIKNKSYPNWPWTYVDDFPMLGELLMAGMYWVHPNLMRLVSIGAYLGIGWVSGRLACQLAPNLDEEARRALFWFVCPSILALRPVAIQSNLLMTDNLASFFALSALTFILDSRIIAGGLFIGLAMATRYFIWGSSLAIFFSLFWILKPSGRVGRGLVNLVVFGSIAPLPFMVRNVLVNGDPIYPLLAAKIQGFNLAHFGGGYGRGGDLLAFFLLPYDFLYTNTHIRGLFDYTLGKLFYIQILLVLAATAYFSWKKRPWLAEKTSCDRRVQAAVVFFIIHLIAWFKGSQQTRFFVPGLVLINISMLVYLFRSLPNLGTATLTLFGLLSVASIQKDSILMALGKRESIFLNSVRDVEGCVARMGNPGLVGHAERFGALGFLDHEWVFTPGHVFSVPAAKDHIPEYVLRYQPAENYIPWPKDDPCGWRRAQVEQLRRTTR